MDKTALKLMNYVEITQTICTTYAPLFHTLNQELTVRKSEL